MRKLALSLVVLAGCAHAPVEAPPAPTTTLGTPQGQQEGPMPAKIDESPETGLGATSTTEAPDMTPTSPPTTIASPRPVQTTVLSVSTPVLGETYSLTLQNCIAYWESGNGTTSNNQFQFTLGTWHTYGGTGDPEYAEFSTQVAIFWLAWSDDGPHHWAAQKGRCF